MHTETSPMAASWAARVSPVGPQPTIRTSTSAGSGRLGTRGATASSDRAIVGSPGRKPLRWNCTVAQISDQVCAVGPLTPGPPYSGGRRRTFDTLVTVRRESDVRVGCGAVRDTCLASAEAPIKGDP